MTEEALRIRTTAKAIFTRRKNDFYSAVAKRKVLTSFKVNSTSLQKLGPPLKVSMIFIKYSFMKRKKFKIMSHGSMNYKKYTMKHNLFSISARVKIL